MEFLHTFNMHMIVVAPYFPELRYNPSGIFSFILVLAWCLLFVDRYVVVVVVESLFVAVEFPLGHGAVGLPVLFIVGTDLQGGIVDDLLVDVVGQLVDGFFYHLPDEQL